LFHQVRHPAEGRQQIISLGPQSVIVLVDTRDLRLHRIQTPELGAEPLVFRDQGFELLLPSAEEPMSLLEPPRGVLVLCVHAIVQLASPSTGPNAGRHISFGSS
jgi:hypothetical protein